MPLNRHALPTSKQLMLLLFSCLLIRLFSLSLYPLMDTTEARYGEMARIMVETGNWITPMFDYNVPFWGKPPIFSWLSSAGFELFGVTEFAARIPHLLVALGILWLTYLLAKTHYNSRKMGLFASSILASSFSFILISGAVTTDTALTFSIALSMVSFWFAWNKKHPIWGYLFFVGLALGMLSKGPLALVLVGISLALWLLPNARWKKLWQVLPWGYGSLLLLLITLPWYALAEYRTPGFLDYFIVGEHIKRFIIGGWKGDLYGTAHERVRGTIWLYGMIAMLPWTPLIFAQWARLLRSNQDTQEAASGFGSFLLCWAIAPLLLFTFAGNILITYVMPSLPATALLLLHYQRQQALPRWLYGIGFLTPAMLIVFITALHFHYGEARSEAGIMAIWKQQKESESADLFYLRHRPFSAQFYSNGKALQRSEANKAWLKAQHKPFFIVQRSDAKESYPNWSCSQRSQERKKTLLYCQQ
ncbi:ArnT family glycosyltransferase [Marinomonas pollencensis]|uniref:Dolichyl-phosphate-mannose-protein mannosyltransferase n=1 Tax=Marinomonas pollencensis TaxID=491954 RepID=A0A3E0DFY7_9GAMM|nr:glycosyltransferase family 39 protein [Marinomonas pollencensis]REG81593.1 dolichyl-phosphate-mannose-protein mannosyltransferase [Marinomonas pollencensis]